MVKDPSASFGFNTPLTDNSAGATNDLSEATVSTVAGKFAHVTNDTTIFNHNKRDLASLAESNDNLLVGFFVTRLGKDAKVGSTTVKSLYRLVETTAKTLRVEGIAEDNGEGRFKVKRLLDLDGCSNFGSNRAIGGGWNGGWIKSE